MKIEHTRLLVNAFTESQSNYAPLIWMFAGKTLINKICKINHRRHQEVDYNEYNILYEETLQFSNNISIHQKHSHLINALL